MPEHPFMQLRKYVCALSTQDRPLFRSGHQGTTSWDAFQTCIVQGVKEGSASILVPHCRLGKA